MGWYKTGTVSVTAGGNAVIGTGTSFIANSCVGDAFRGPDGGWYEVTNIASDTALSIAPNYQGATLAAGGYSLAPMQGYVKDSADALRAATQVIGQVGTDVSAQVKLAADAATASQGSAAASDTSATNAASSATSANSSKVAAKASENAAKVSETNSKTSETNSATSRTNAANSATAAANSATQAADSAASVANKANSGANSDITSLSGLTTPLSVAQGGTGSQSGLPNFGGAGTGGAGTRGLVPAPSAGATRFLSSLGTWLPVNTTVSWGGITGTLADQTDLKSALDAKGSVITKYFESQQTSWVINSDLVFTHSLGQPRVVEFEAVLTAALSGYPVGTRVKVPFYVNGGAYWGCQIIGMTATTLTIRFSNQMGLLQSSTGAVVMTPANSQIIARVMS
ncbi:hypothetical protein [Pseudomonas sp. B14(2022)]|uniref:hypothetical protein n=1 Tax=Pseudomonas sp. B14(2022) TaxID=2914043 RepID=UPI001F39DCB9|nr:hypothetical protein [Pseudomonas sp. B14(2022)]